MYIHLNIILSYHITDEETKTKTNSFVSRW